jgi:hypothetical protein
MNAHNPPDSYGRGIGLENSVNNFASSQSSKSSPLFCRMSVAAAFIEGAYAVCGNQLHVRDHEDRSWTVALNPGDNAEILARKLLREKFGQHHSFDQPIHYPPRSYH